MTAPFPLRSKSFEQAKPALSVLVPFYKDSPLPLLKALFCLAPEAVEVILLDDGSQDSAITRSLLDFIQQSGLAVELITLKDNEGRARGRNRLTTAARGDYFLFLDADMVPPDEAFLNRWLAHIKADQPSVSFGGFVMPKTLTDRRFALHKAMSERGDCLSAADRALSPEKYIFTSNLLVRRDVFDIEGFDPAFQGWGWEDVEWAMRVGKKFAISHIENPAIHMGLDTADTLLRKFDQSGANFARVIAKHPAIVKSYPSYRAARVFSRFPLRKIWRNLLKSLVRFELLPANVRAFCLRLYRAFVYADVVS